MAVLDPACATTSPAAPAAPATPFKTEQGHDAQWGATLTPALNVATFSATINHPTQGTQSFEVMRTADAKAVVCKATNITRSEIGNTLGDSNLFGSMLDDTQGSRIAESFPRQVRGLGQQLEAPRPGPQMTLR